MSPSSPSTEPTIAVRRARREDRDALMTFYREQHAQRARLIDPAIWDWLFVQQPYASDRLPFFVLESNGRIVGGIGYIRAKLSVEGGQVEASFPINYFIDPAYKGLPALRLFRAVLNESPLAIGAYVSPDAMRLLLKSGFADLSDAFCNYYYGLQAGSPSLRGMALALARRMAEWGRRLWGALRHPAVSYRLGAELDAAFAKELTATSGAISVCKTFEWLEWRYVKSPLLKSQFVYQFQAGRPAALAIIFIDTARDELVLLDFLSAPAAACLTGLIDRLIVVARANHCRTIATHALSDSLGRHARACLFASMKSDLGLAVFARDKPLRNLLVDVHRWHLMLGDTDAY